MQNHSYADIFRPDLKKESLVYDFLLTIGGSVFIALSAQVAVNVPFSPVPITGQTFAVLLIGAFFGRRLGTLAIIAYLLEGSVGLPVFAQAHAGLAHLFGPTGGYLIGFIPAAYLCGYFTERGWGKSFIGALGMMIIGTIIIFISGLLWLAVLLDSQNLLMLGFYPYIGGAILKIILASLIISGSWQLLKRNTI